MKQIDRFLRIIYKDFSLQRVFRTEMDSYSHDKTLTKNWHSLFWLTHSQFEFGPDYLYEVKKIYQEVYHDYNEVSGSE